MITNRQLITDALSAVGLIGEGQAASDTQVADGLRALNAMVLAWTQEDIDLQYFEQVDPAATTPIPPYSLMGVTACLAVYLAADSGAPVSQGLQIRASDGYEAIVRASIRANRREADMTDLPMGEAGNYR